MATADEIKKAYRKLAVVHHPDKGGDEEWFRNIAAAHKTLSDEDKRRRYGDFGDADGEAGDDLFSSLAEVFSSDVFKDAGIDIKLY